MKLTDGALGYFYNNGSSVQYNDQFVGLFSSAFSRANGLSIIPENFLKVNALYAARKLITNSWEQHKDEYFVPVPIDTESDAYKQWNADAVIYSLFHHSNNSTSMRQVNYNNQTWTIHNHYFWIPHKTALELLDDPKTSNLYRDCRNNPAKDVFGNPIISTPDTYLAHILPSLTVSLSNEAKAVLEGMTALWKQSLPLRETYAQEHPEYQLNTWDAGIYQLKYLWRDLFPKEWEALRQAHARLANKLRPGVYDHGWLCK